MGTQNNSPEELRAKAKKYLDKASQIESKRFIKSGKIVDRYQKNNFKDCNFDTFKREVQKYYP